MIAVLAIARATAVAAWRGGAAKAMAGLLVVVMLWLPGYAGGGDAGLWQIALSVAQALLLLGAGWLAVDSLGRDLREGQACLLATRPLDRAQWWLGRWLGVTLVVWLLLLGVLVLALAQSRGVCPTPHVEVTAELPRPLVLAPGQPTAVSLEGGRGELLITVRAPHALDQPVRLDAVADSGESLGLDVMPDRLYRVAWPGGTRVILINRGDVLLGVSRGDLRLRGPLPGAGANAARAAAMMAMQLAFAAALGTAAASALSYPVALFAVLAWLVAAAHAPLLPTTPIGAPAHGDHAHEHGDEPLSTAWLATMNAGRVAGLWLTDAVHRWWRLGDVARGRLVPPADLGRAVLRLGLAQTGVVVLMGIWLWRRREFGLEDRP